MNSKYRYILVLLAIAALFISGCSEDYTSPEDGTKSETLRNHLVANDMDLPDMLSNAYMVASDLHGNEATYYIMDIRSESLFNEGHVPSAVLSSLTGIITDAASSESKPIVVVCKTGQTAGHAVVALRLSGYSNAMVLKFGMSSWHSDFDNWTTNTSSFALTEDNWIAPPGNIAATTEHDYPSITASATDGAGILAERVSAMLAGGFKGIPAVDVLTTPSGYFINNYWAAGDVIAYGNITGANRINPMALETGTLRGNDPGANVVTYCWTSQTSSMITAYLTVLGYDATSLKYGANGMIYDDLETTKQWVGSFDYMYDSITRLQ
jgi:rhodanese-related sulfurtransferase